MADQKLFKVPILGWLIRSLGAFPVNPTRGKGREAYEAAKKLVLAGKVVGIFPEGKRSHSPRMEAIIREGAARLAWETGAPLIPATITGAYRAWPYFRPLPKPAHIRVRFHRPIDPKVYMGWGEEEEAITTMIVEWRRRVDRSLMPGAKADERIVALYGAPAPPPRAHEIAVAVAAAILVVLGGAWPFLFGPVLYAAYLLADRYAIPQRRLVKWLRNTSPLLFIWSFGPLVLEVLERPPIPAGTALLSILVGSLIPYFYERSSIALGFVRGMIIAALLEVGALYFAPSGLGPHVALPLFAAAYAIQHTTVFWKYAAPFLVLYAEASTWLMGGGRDLLVHVGVAVLAFFVVRLWPYRLSASAASAELTPVKG
jgi:1-acyl-sn-glycerol-3-phosphate acyltransferase